MKPMRFVVLAFALIALPVAADPSLECSVRSGSQVETSQCLADMEEAANEALQIILSAARESAAELDTITERDVAGPALEASQTAWEDHRKAFCDYAGSLFGGGSGTGIEIRSCRIELTRQWTKALQSKIN